MRRGAAMVLACLPGAVAAAPYADLGHLEQCGTYAEASYDRDSYFPGGEGGVMALTQAQSVRGLNAVLFDGILTEEGLNEPLGRVMAVRGPLVGAGGQIAPEVVVMVTTNGIRLLQPCP